MVSLVDITNRALQDIGTRTTISSMTENSNEAIQANLIIQPVCDELMRMAQWNCGTDYVNLTYITSAPGTPENTTQPTTLWAKGQPAPPWSYEFQYPVQCLRPLWIIPQYQTGFSGGIPITTAVTGAAAQFWSGPPVKFKVAIDQFMPVTAATKVAGGTGYVVGDQITLASGASSATPIGAPVVLQVATLSGSAVATVSVVSQVANEATPLGGSYFLVQSGTIAQGSTTGVGTGATFSLTFGSQISQRVILTNQESALLCYLRQLTDPNLADPQFIEAWVKALGGRLAFQLTGDTATANGKLAEANNMIAIARQADANEGLTINDVTPDWIRVRGIVYPQQVGVPNCDFDWGPTFSMY